MVPRSPLYSHPPAAFPQHPVRIRLPNRPRLPVLPRLHRLLEVADKSDDPAHNGDHPIHRFPLLLAQCRVGGEQLRFGQERRQRIVQLVLGDRRDALQLGDHTGLARQRRSMIVVHARLLRSPWDDIFHSAMTSPPADTAAAIALAVETYRESNDFSVLLDRLLEIAGAADLDDLIAAVDPYRTIPEIAGPIYERVVAERPDDARALVTLANAYWLSGRGAEATGDLAARALAADPANRAAWHLWALTEPEPRSRMLRWKQVTERFSDDLLARATLADAAASVAGAERDREALQLAIRSYDTLLKTATRPEERAALETALTTLRGWSL